MKILLKVGVVIIIVLFIIPTNVIAGFPTPHNIILRFPLDENHILRDNNYIIGAFSDEEEITSDCQGWNDFISCSISPIDQPEKKSKTIPIIIKIFQSPFTLSSDPRGIRGKCTQISTGDKFCYSYYRNNDERPDGAFSIDQLVAISEHELTLYTSPVFTKDVSISFNGNELTIFSDPDKATIKPNFFSQNFNLIIALIIIFSLVFIYKFILPRKKQKLTKNTSQ